MKRLKKVLAYIMSVSMIVSLLPVYSANAQVVSENRVSGNHGRIKSNVNLYKSTEKKQKPRKGTLPSSYDSRKYGYITSIKNQGEYGSCWAFGALNACEASLIKNNGYSVDDVNLAETHLCYSAYAEAYDSLGLLTGDRTRLSSEYRDYGSIDVGGDIYTSTMTLARWQGAVDEVDNPDYAYSKASRTFSFSSKPTDAYSLNEVQLTDAQWVDINDRDSVKSLVMQYGAGDFGYFHDDYDEFQEGMFYSDKYNSYCYIQSVTPEHDDFEWPNHEVSIVGWDDNFPKENFTSYSRPTKNGAWLCKNSWGENWGDNGYFWISYEDSSILTEYVGFYKLNSVGTFDNNYQYDGTINASSQYVIDNNGVYTANVFTAQNDEILKAVSFYTYDEDVNYSIDIYKGVSSTKPNSGKKALATSVTGNLEYCGYHTVNLPASVLINKDEKFSVVIRIYSDSASELHIPCDKSLDQGWVSYTNAASSGQSFYSDNGTAWVDISSKDKINFRIKAFTVNQAGISSDTETESDIKIESDTETESDIKIESDTETETDTFHISEDLLSPSVLRIDEAQENFVDGSNVTVIGQVVYKFSMTENGGYKNTIIQDVSNGETIGILLYDSTGRYDLDIGSIVEVTGEIITFNGLREIKNIMDITVKADNYKLIPAQKLSLSEILENPQSYINETIYLSDVSLVKNSETGTVEIEQSGKKISVFDSDTCPDIILEDHTMDLKCVLSVYNGMYQLRVGSSSDYIFNEINSDSDTTETDSSFSDTDTSSDSTTDSDLPSDTDSTSVIKGDVDGDGNVNMVDVVTVQKHIALLITLSGDKLNAADVNNDGNITMVDITTMQKYIAKLITSFESSTKKLYVVKRAYRVNPYVNNIMQISFR